ncbi:MAG: hypothetical protein DHS20C21_04340 [Gemmatimonadota bacterium]|nr:MAG: hypothetical protein DHS20C21_04340 [Gemmatimonadota bacterium]
MRSLRLAALGAAVAGYVSAGSPVVAQEPSADAATAPSIVNGREYLVPELAGSTFHVSEGTRPFRHRLSFSPAFGTLGDDRLFAVRGTYHPSSWLAWEAGIGHAPGESVHALVHTVSGVLRYPLPSRFQPYVAGGYGMILVFPGESLNADPVTENTLTMGGGLEFYVRDDLALRVERRGVYIIGDDPVTSGSATYQYGETTVGLAFYRGLGN